MVEVLGLRVVDETRVNGFFNCGNDHHCIVVGRRQSPTLNHIAFEIPDLDSVMRMAGTMREAGYPIEWGVGRHGPGNNVFAYFAGPEEFRSSVPPRSSRSTIPIATAGQTSGRFFPVAPIMGGDRTAVRAHQADPRHLSVSGVATSLNYRVWPPGL